MLTAAGLVTAARPAGAQAGSSPRWYDSLTGWVEARAGARLQDDEPQKAASAGELRLQLAHEWDVGRAALVRVSGDFLYDAVERSHGVDLETGRGIVDLREAYVVFRLPLADIKVGRQILTWGTGDLVFINDLFPKDYRSFFIGRDDEYLKAPSDAVRVSLFHDVANLDLAYTPRFDADRFVDGSRLSYFDPTTGGTVGGDVLVDPVRPETWFGDGEIAVRVYRQLGAFEASAHGYRGFWKSPRGARPDGRPFFPALAVYGGSLRGPFAGGIGYAEVGFYDSLDSADRFDEPAGASPSAATVPGHEQRYLVGFEREARPELTVGVQYYAVRAGMAGASPQAPPARAAEAHRTRHTLTLRVTKLALRQDLTASAFTFWSPDEEDVYVRGGVTYRLNDDWRIDAGVNLFSGSRDTDFGQLRDGSNVYGGLRRSF